MQELGQHLLELVRRHPGKTVGSALGLTVGLLVITLGVLRTLFVLACLVGGFYLGARIDGAPSDSVWPTRWRQGRWRP